MSSHYLVATCAACWFRAHIEIEDLAVEAWTAGVWGLVPSRPRSTTHTVFSDNPVKALVRAVLRLCSLQFSQGVSQDYAGPVCLA